MSEFSRRRPSWTRREPYEPQWEKDRRVKIQKYLAEHGDKAELPEGTTAQQWLDPKWKGPMRNPDFFDRMEQEKDVGLQAARVRQRLLEQQVFTHDRFQASWAMRNMVKALNLHVWRNTLEDWQRLFETQIILAARARKAKGGAMFGPPIGGKAARKANPTKPVKEDYVLLLDDEKIARGTSLELAAYLRRISAGKNAGYRIVPYYLTLGR